MSYYCFLSPITVLTSTKRAMYRDYPVDTKLSQMCWYYLDKVMCSETQQAKKCKVKVPTVLLERKWD